MLKLVFMAPRSGMDEQMNQMMHEIHAALGGDQDYAGYHEDPDDELYTLAIGDPNGYDKEIWIENWFSMKFRG